MTRKPIRTMVTRYGDAGPWLVYLGPYSPFVANPSQATPQTLADRYTATGTGTPPDIRVTVTDRETGATANVRDVDIILTIPDTATKADAARLLHDARTIIGIARRQTGGPAVGTGLRPSHVIAAILDLWNPEPPPEGLPPTEPNVANRLGTDHDGRTIRRIGEQLPGPGTPWERLLRDARIARRLDSVRLASSRSAPSVPDDGGDARIRQPPPLVTGNADPPANKSRRPPNTRRR
jgi:hypothetical protein